jgi:hypothetical protein
METVFSQTDQFAGGWELYRAASEYANSIKVNGRL